MFNFARKGGLTLESFSGRNVYGSSFGLGGAIGGTGWDALHAPIYRPKRVFAAEDRP